MSVQNVAMMYPVREQKKDKEKYFGKIGKFSVGAYIANSNRPTCTQHYQGEGNKEGFPYASGRGATDSRTKL